MYKSVMELGGVICCMLFIYMQIFSYTVFYVNVLYKMVSELHEICLDVT